MGIFIMYGANYQVQMSTLNINLENRHYYDLLNMVNKNQNNNNNKGPFSYKRMSNHYIVNNKKNTNAIHENLKHWIKYWVQNKDKSFITGAGQHGQFRIKMIRAKPKTSKAQDHLKELEEMSKTLKNLHIMWTRV